MIRLVVYSFLFTISTIYSFAQKQALTFKEADSLGISTKHLDSIHQSAIHVDSNIAVFKGGNSDDFFNAYTGFIKAMGKYFKENGLVFEDDTKIYNRIYFSKSGEVNYYLYRFLTEFPEEKKELFHSLLNQFIQENKIEASADVDFSQYSPVLFQKK